MVLQFCPLCKNLLNLQEGHDGLYDFVCTICPVRIPITKTIRVRTYFTLKKEDDIYTEDEAWKYVSTTQEPCPKCWHPQAFYLQVQTRSADEPMTIFYRCCKSGCHHTWKD
ncbi:hypothetical protein WA026_019779 [Henosepilachna vigintioctopunctata]|uniref:DNA-directed RNA polymerase subunit n=1 Tax=Henosepilachna vigintioctopunctata TaxID=420089 RepID=A0AAW1VIF6_9CUCU